MTGEGVMTASQAAELAASASAAGIRLWLMGGWGIDALLGQETRSHHDLDVLVSAGDLPALHDLLRQQGFTRAYAWEENDPVTLEGRSWDTAFVEHHHDGRELDVHAVDVEDGSVSLRTKDPWVLPPDSLDGTGTILGRAVPCVSAEAQRAMHRGYDLPTKHREDLRRLEQL
jgi:lincosamide nucleotidyltransferase A/C/D/E